MPVSLQLQLGHLFREVKFPECKMYDERHELCIQETLLREIDYPVCPKIEKTWFLLVHLVTTYHGGKKHLSE